MNPILAFLAGLFFASSIAGWVCAHVERCKAIAADAKANYLAMQWQQVAHSNAQLISQVAKLQTQLREMGDDTEGDEWKHGSN